MAQFVYVVDVDRLQSYLDVADLRVVAVIWLLHVHLRRALIRKLEFSGKFKNVASKQNLIKFNLAVSTLAINTKHEYSIGEVVVARESL